MDTGQWVREVQAELEKDRGQTLDAVKNGRDAVRRRGGGRLISLMVLAGTIGSSYIYLNGKGVITREHSSSVSQFPASQNGGYNSGKGTVEEDRKPIDAVPSTAQNVGVEQREEVQITPVVRAAERAGFLDSNGRLKRRLSAQ